MKRIASSIFLIINYKTLLLVILSLASTYLCHYYQFTADFPLTLVSVAIVFPVVFSIDTAYKRRENALKHFADFKGHAVSIYYGCRDWVEVSNSEIPTRVKNLTVEMLYTIKALFKSTTAEESHKQEVNIYQKFSDLSRLLQELRAQGLPAGEVSRVNQYLSKMIIAFDNMKIVHHYRTPVTLRAYSKGFIYLFPILYGPYFAFTFDQYSFGLGYLMPILYSFILVSLDNIQDHLENPYDEVGEDDVRIEVDEFIRIL